MPRGVRHRQPGQTIVFAAVVMVAVIGALAMVIDSGIFFVIQRQLQSAADAGALAGAWHDPICSTAAGNLYCYPPSAVVVATTVAQANGDNVKPLCGGTVSIVVATGTTLVLPHNVNAIVVTAECDAGYSFGRILGLGTKHISASAAAAIGDRDANGDMTDFTPDPGIANPACTPVTPDKCRIARLIE